MRVSSTQPMHTADPAPDADSRLAIARRFYLYGVTLVSYLVALAALNALLGILDQSLFGGQQAALYAVNFGSFYRDALAGNGGLLLVAVPLFLLHWRFAENLARRSTDEAGAGMRKFFLYVALGAVFIYGLTAFYRLLTGIGLLAVGVSVEQSEIWPTGWLQALGTVILSFALARHWLATLARDGDLGQEIGMAGFWRRLYQTLAGLASLVLIILGGSQMIQAVWQFFTGMLAFTAGDLWQRAPVVYGMSGLLIGGYLLRLNWRTWQAIYRDHPAERSRGLRRFYLYGAVVIGALATLAPAAGLLEELLRIVLGVGTGDRWALVDGLGRPISLIPLGFAVWMWHWRYLRSEEAVAPASQESATIRRLYYYAVAATGLVLLWLGAVEIVQAGLDRFLVYSATPATAYWVEGLAHGLSLVIVGGPIWAFHWRAVENVARREDEPGRAERASGPRRVYLYGVALVGALLILAFLAQVAYRGFLWVLGDPDAGFFSPQAAGDLARSLIAAALWTVHILAIRRDGQMGAAIPAAEAGELADPALAGIDGVRQDTTQPAQRTELEARIRRLEGELAAAKRALAVLAEETEQ